MLKLGFIIALSIIGVDVLAGVNFNYRFASKVNLNHSSQKRYISPNKFVGILYETWFNHVNQNTLRPVYPDPVSLPDFRYWGEPALGRYSSDDTFIINTHADLLAGAGVDFILIDFSNSNIYIKTMLDPTLRLLDVYSDRLRKRIPTPRVVFLMSTTNCQIAVLYNLIYTRYDKSLFFHYGEKPLLLADNSSIPFADRFMCIETTGLRGSDQKWSFLERTPQPVFKRDGWAEEMAVSAAQQETYMSALTAHGRFYDFKMAKNNGYEGQNFIDQWVQANSNNPTFVIVKSWNEWVAQRLSKDFDPNCPGDDCYTDEYNREFSNDIEPMKGGHGDRYFRIMEEEIHKYKRNSPNFIFRDNVTGIWYFKYGRKGERFASSNYTNTFTWAAGSHYQPIVGDFNNDGWTDIGLRDTTTGQWHFAFFAGDRSYQHTTSFTWAVGSHYQPIVDDFDNDGRTDIGLRDTTTGIWHFALFSVESKSYHHTKSFQWAVGPHYQPLVGDFDNDGKTDIGLRDTTTGIWHFALFDGNTNYRHTRDFPWSVGARYQAFVGDFDCDEKLDIGLRDTITGNIHLANFDGNEHYHSYAVYPWKADGNTTILIDQLQCN